MVKRCQNVLHLVISQCFFLVFKVAYLTWGIIQERIMTIEFGKTADNPGEKFTNSQFLVFVNRFASSRM